MRFWITNHRPAHIKTSVTYKPKTWKIEKLEDKIPKLSDKDKLKLKIAQIILERLTGKRVKFTLLEKEISTEPQETIDISQHAVESNQPQGWGFVYENKQVYSEEEKTRHNIRALVNVLQKKVGPELAPFIHLSATSEDITGSAQALRMRDVFFRVVIPLCIKLLTVLTAIGIREAATAQIG